MPKSRVARQPEVIAGLRAGVERLLAGGKTYSEISIDALVAEGGLAKSTFYVYFKDKDELLRVIAADVMRDLIDYQDAWWTLPPDATKDETGDAIAATFHAYRTYGALIASIVQAAIYDPLMREQFDLLMNGAVAATAEHLRAGQSAGVVSRDLDAERTAFWITWTLEAGFNLLLQGSTAAELDVQLQAMTELIWNVSRGGHP